jgi:lipoprotein-anchoring transpeptidase ErfK/SrfK
MKRDPIFRFSFFILLAILLTVIIIVFSTVKISLSKEINKQERTLAYQTIKEGDTLWSLFGKNWPLVAKINGISPNFLIPGTLIVYPSNMNYCPLPKEIKHYQGTATKIIFINLSEQVLGGYYQGKLWKWMPISSGKKGYETPKGEFRITEKKKEHYSNLWPKPNGGAPMPYSIRFNGPYMIHAGDLPGEPASHGCVRLEKQNAKELFFWTNSKTKIIIK